jgi:hypothetical protein
MFEVYFQNGTSVTTTTLDIMIATLRFRRDITNIISIVHKWREPRSYILHERATHVRVKNFEELERVMISTYGLRKYSF